MSQNIEKQVRQSAILLIGPTGAGKTPLGDLLEAAGLWGKRCLHFDFGSELRAAARQPAGPLTPRERDLVQKLLGSGALLEDEHFPIARKLLVSFLSRRKADRDTLVVLNGLPRHAGQARDIEPIIDMRALVSLECTPQTVWERIRTNAGGDRAQRADDTLEAVKQRLAVFRRRTAPLLAYYRSRGVSVLQVNVGVTTTAEQMRRELETHRLPAAPNASI